MGQLDPTASGPAAPPPYDPCPVSPDDRVVLTTRTPRQSSKRRSWPRHATLRWRAHSRRSVLSSCTPRTCRDVLSLATALERPVRTFGVEFPPDRALNLTRRRLS
jgi:hypothetical protein